MGFADCEAKGLGYLLEHVVQGNGLGFFRFCVLILIKYFVIHMIFL